MASLPTPGGGRRVGPVVRHLEGGGQGKPPQRPWAGGDEHIWVQAVCGGGGCRASTHSPSGQKYIVGRLRGFEVFRTLFLNTHTFKNKGKNAQTHTPTRTHAPTRARKHAPQPTVHSHSHSRQHAKWCAFAMRLTGARWSLTSKTGRRKKIE